MQTNITKLFIAVIPLLSVQALAQFDPMPTPRPDRSLRCYGQGDYPSAYISYNDRNHEFTVGLSYDLDVPGGATGTVIKIGTGSVTHEKIDIHMSEGDGGSVKGTWQGSSYQTHISTSGIEADFVCYSNQ